MTVFGALRDRLLLEGLMPERALLRLRRAGIGIYNAKKIEKNQILFSVKKKDTEKVFAIYPNVCYNETVYKPYAVKKLGAEGLGKYVETGKRRVGFLLGGLLCIAAVLACQPLVFTVEFVGTDVYKREVYAALEEGGITPFAPYKTGKEDWICSRILAIDGVEYCSVKKDGHRVVVEVQTSPFPSAIADEGPMRAKHTGKLVAMTVLRGTPLKKAGEEVRAGETLAGNWFSTEDGGQVRVEIIARACIACTYTCDVEAESGEEAFAKAYLAIGLSETDEIQKTEIAENGTHYRVTVEYTAVETINF